MTEAGERLAALQRLLDEEMVPLSVASTVAYFHLTQLERQVSSDRRLAEVVQLAAIALSQVAPIRRAPGGELLSVAQVNELIFHPLRAGRTVDLDGFAIRRGDLRVALTTMREARMAFGRE